MDRLPAVGGSGHQACAEVHGQRREGGPPWGLAWSRRAWMAAPSLAAPRRSRGRGKFTVSMIHRAVPSEGQPASAQKAVDQGECFPPTRWLCHGWPGSIRLCHQVTSLWL